MLLPKPDLFRAQFPLVIIFFKCALKQNQKLPNINLNRRKINANMSDRIDINEHRRHLNKLDLEIEKTLQELQNLNELGKSAQPTRPQFPYKKELVSTGTEITPTKFTSPSDYPNQGVNLRTGLPRSRSKDRMLQPPPYPGISKVPFQREYSAGGSRDSSAGRNSPIEYHHGQPLSQARLKTPGSQPDLNRIPSLPSDGNTPLVPPISEKLSIVSLHKETPIIASPFTPPLSTRASGNEKVNPHKPHPLLVQGKVKVDNPIVANLRQQRPSPRKQQETREGRGSRTGAELRNSGSRSREQIEPKVPDLGLGNKIEDLELRVEDRLLEYGRLKKEKMDAIEIEKINTAREMANRRNYSSRERYSSNEHSGRHDSPPQPSILKRDSPKRDALDSARNRVRFNEDKILEEIKMRQQTLTTEQSALPSDRLLTTNATLTNLTQDERRKINQEQKQLLDFLMKSARRSPGKRMETEELYALASSRSAARSLTPRKSERAVTTFQPEINENSRKIAARLGDARKRVTQSTTGKVRDKNRVLENYKKELTFHPNINATSRKLDEQFKAVQFQGNDLHRWDQLYLMKDKYNIDLQMKRLEKEREEVENENYTFQPKLSPLNNNIVRHTGIEFADRARRWQENKDKRLTMERDAQTAREMEECTFKPRVTAANIAENGQVYIRGLDQHFERVDAVTKRKKELEFRTNKFTGKTWKNQVTKPVEFNFLVAGPRSGISPLKEKSRSRSPINDKNNKKSPRDVSPRGLINYDSNEGYGPKQHPPRAMDQINHLHKYLHNLQI